MSLDNLCELASDRTHIEIVLYYEPGRDQIAPHIHPLLGRMLEYREWLELQDLVANWYELHSDDEIEKTNAAWFPPRPEHAPGQAQQQQYDGWIYVLQADQYYKIGQTVDLDRRLTQIVPQLPFPAELAHTFHTSDMNATETALHEKFADKRTHGEWFRLDEDDIAWLKSQ